MELLKLARMVSLQMGIIRRIDEIKGMYRGTNVKEARRCYDYCVNLMIEQSQLEQEYKNELLRYWEKTR